MHVNAETLRTMESIINREVVNSGNLLVRLLLCYVKLSDVVDVTKRLNNIKINDNRLYNNNNNKIIIIKFKIIQHNTHCNNVL